MESFGGTDLQVEDYNCVNVRVRALHALPALYPRLGIRLGWTLTEYPARETPMRRGGIENYRMIGLAADLLLGEGGPHIAQLWPTRDIDFRSQPGTYENQLVLACDLDLGILERIEERRAGEPLKLAIDLRPQMVRGPDRLHTNVSRTLAFPIPREEWQKFLTSVGFGNYAVLEIELPTLDFEDAQKTIEQLRLAGAKLSAGEYNLAVTAARTALETVLHRVPRTTESKTHVKDWLVALTDQERGDAYAGIVTRAKTLCNQSVHRAQSSFAYSRSEAQFIVRTVENAVALLGRFLSSPPAA